MSVPAWSLSLIHIYKDELLLDLAGLLVGETDVGQKRGLIGHVLLTALVHGVGRVAELMVTEGHLELVAVSYTHLDVYKRQMSNIRETSGDPG